jgi:hypothetical protein
VSLPACFLAVVSWASPVHHILHHDGLKPLNPWAKISLSSFEWFPSGICHTGKSLMTQKIDTREVGS